MSILEETGVDIRAVAVDQIDPNAWNPNAMEAEFFDHLSAAVKEEGMNQPVLVREKGDGRFEIVDGEHRWRSAKVVGVSTIAVVVVPWDETRAKVRTLSMNAIRGINIPIRLGRLIADLGQTYTADEIAAMTGIRKDEQEVVLKLIETPDLDMAKEVENFGIGLDDVSRPIAVQLMLMPDEHREYSDAMKFAMELAGDRVTPLVGQEVEDYDLAMTSAMKLTGTKMRNVALAAICETFNALPKEMREEAMEQIRVRIAAKLPAAAADTPMVVQLAAEQPIHLSV